jgi:hypothetical protein
MNPPTREEFDALKRRFEQLERETEPIRLERRLSIPEANTLQTIMDMVGTQATDVAVLKTDMGTLKQDVSVLKQTVATQAHVDERFNAMEKRFDAIAEVQKRILEKLDKQ